MNIIDILICPECKNPLTLSEDLECKGCNNQYIAQNNGVLNLVSQKLSGALLQEQKEASNFLQSKNKNNEPINNSESVKEIKKDEQDWEELSWEQIHQKMNDFINPLLNTLSGIVCDLATGIGSHLQRLLNLESKDFNIVCIDIERTALGLAAMQKNPRIFCVVGDARYMPVKDNSFDYITSHGVFCEVGECDKVAKEIYRTLKPNGRIIIRGEYIDKNDSESVELAKSMKLEKGIIEENLIQELENAGFKNIVSTIVAKSKRDVQEGILPPVAGDRIYFYVIQAEKC
jgi:ubiquinone/menaquinone biosynthesis C-methylase UbiE